MSAPKFAPGRCNYCAAPAVVSITWQSWYSKMGSRRALTMHARACAEHQGCVNFRSHVEFAKGPVVRAPAITATVYTLCPECAAPPACPCGHTIDVYECGHCSEPVCAHCAAVWDDDESVCKPCERKAEESYHASRQVAREDDAAGFA